MMHQHHSADPRENAVPEYRHECRCPSCRRLLFKRTLDAPARIEIVCPKCGKSSRW